MAKDRIILEHDCIKHLKGLKVCVDRNGDGSFMISCGTHLLCLPKKEADKLCKWWLKDGN